MKLIPYKLLIGSLGGLLVASLPAQTANSDTLSEMDIDDETIVLNPFEVSSGSDEGYAANETLDGTRFRSNMKDVPAQISIMTKEFLEDIAAVTAEDAFRYSANIENLSEFSSAGNGDYAAGILNLGGQRIRGLGDAGRSRDFFRTTLPRDTYNIDRISISSGPNAILFGNGNPGGVVNSAFMRADPGRPKYELSVRVDNYGSLRGSVDINQPIIEGKLALRVAGMSSEDQYYQEPAFRNEDRISAALTFKPTNSTTIRAYVEDAQRDAITVRNTRASDQVTPWINAGRPAFDNSVKPYVLDSLILSTNTNNQIILVSNSVGEAQQFINYRNNSVNTQGPEDAYAGIDRYNYSLPDDTSLLPNDVNIDGDGTGHKFWGTVYGAAIEQRLPGGGYFEAAYNRESFEMWAMDTLRGSSPLRADANLYLPDLVTPNPDFGRFYLESNIPRIMARFSEFEEARAQVSYDLDFQDRQGLGKWLGRHRLAGMAQRSEFVENTQQEFQARLLPDSMSEADKMDLFRSGIAGNNDLVRIRYYLDEPGTPGGSYSLKTPFNFLETTSAPWGNGTTYWGGVNNPYGGTSQPTIPNVRIDSWVFASQSFFFDDRLVVSYGRRHDKSGSASYRVQNLTSNSRSGYESLLEVPIATDFSDYTSGDTTTLGAVAHVMPWLSVFYNESTTWNPETQFSNPDDGSRIGGSVGDGQDYGVMLRFFDNRLSLRINRYTNTNGPAENITYRNAIVPQVQNIERKIYDAAEAGIIAPVPLPEFYNPLVSSTYQETSLTSELESTGYEFSLTANPTRNWRLTLNGAKAESTASDIGGAWVDFIQDRANVWANYSNIEAEGNASDTVGSRYLGIIQTLNQMAQADGQKVEQGREWRFNLVTRYGFNEGRLKGAFVGGGYRWRSKPVLGYSLTLVDNAFPFAGSPAQIQVPALDSPIYGKPLTEIDAFVGYSRKLTEKIKWRVQLNVRNLFNDRDPVAQRANLTDGFVTRYYVPTPRSFILTNTFTF